MVPELPDDLLEAARQGRLNILVGAGVSMDAGLPGWSDLLRDLSKQTPRDKRAGVERLIQADRLLDAAQLISQYLNPYERHRALQRSLRDAREPSPLHRAVWALRSPFVLTTNFDRLLEVAHVQVRGHAVGVMVGTDPAGLAVHGWDARLCKLHGDLGKPESIVLSRDEYFATIARSQGIGSAVWAQFAERPCLALGFSLRDPDIQMLLSWMTSGMRGYAQTFYLLTSQSRQEELDLLGSVGNVRPIRYWSANGHREPLMEVLDALAAERAPYEYVASVSPAKLALLQRVRAEIGVIVHEHLGELQAGCLSVAAMLRQNRPVGPESLREAFKSITDQLKAFGNDVRHLLTEESERLQASTWTQCRERLQWDLRYRKYRGVQTDGLHLRLDAEVPIGSILFSRLVRILIDNAIDATKNLPQQQVVVAAGRTRSNGRSYLSLTVADNGPGIDASVMDTLFRPGSTTKGEGHGSGLFLLRSIAEECGGSVTLTSDRDRGTTAQFVVPITSVSRQPGVSNRGGSDGSSRPPTVPVGLRVLVLEDHEKVAREIADVLQRMDCRVTVETSPSAAINRLRRSRRAPDMLVCDVVAPGGRTGLDVIHAAREKFGEVPAVVVSGYVNAGRTGRLTNTVFLNKPIDPKDLVQAISSLCS